jgi:hypothetical protein
MPARYASLQQVRLGLDRFMRDRLGMKQPVRALAFYYWMQLQEQILAVLPITACLVLTMAIYFKHSVSAPGKLAGGLISAIFGLLLFMDGLRVSIMPLGDLIGHTLPEKFKVRYILMIACALGILCTYAEPAIASLRPLADLVNRCDTPYLFLVLNDFQEILVLTIGLGVGVAAMFGVLRFLRGWSLKPLIVISMTPTIACACYMTWGNPDLAPLIGLAWDCGGVTTGPVTVPILLSLGIGVMKGQRARQEAREILQEKSGKNQGKSLEGFGIVTLASAFPILAVEVLSIVLSLRYTRDEVRTNFGKQNCTVGTDIVSATPAAVASDAALVADAILIALRSILPLNAFLIILIVFVLRESLPIVTFGVPIPTDILPDTADAGRDDCCSHGQKQPGPSELAAEPDHDGTAKAAAACLVPFTDSDTDDEPADDPAASDACKISQHPGLRDHTQGCADDEGEIREDERARRRRLRQERKARMARAVDLAVQTAPPGRREKRQASLDAQRAEMPGPGPPLSAWGRLRRHGPLLLGIAESQAGMMLFNIGLTYGFTSLGNESGELLPSAFLATGTPGTPLYAYGPGVAIVVVTVFVLGFLATRAEPALRVMGRTVEALSEGRFTTSMLIYTVCVGVACGLVVGSVKILFSVNLTVIILAAYAAASLLTVCSSEEFTNIGWDSAGVTTGPVTVPFVLSIGIGFAKATGAQEVPAPSIRPAPPPAISPAAPPASAATPPPSSPPPLFTPLSVLRVAPLRSP